MTTTIMQVSPKSVFNKATYFVVRDREAGNIIETFDTEQKANNAVNEYEASDLANDIYEEGFYEVVNSNTLNA